MGIVYSRTKPPSNFQSVPKLVEVVVDDTGKVEDGVVSKAFEETPVLATTQMDSGTSSTVETPATASPQKAHYEDPLRKDTDSQDQPDGMETDLNETSVVMDIDEEFSPPRFSTPLRKLSPSKIRCDAVVDIDAIQSHGTVRAVQRSIFVSPSQAQTQELAFSGSKVFDAQFERDADETFYNEQSNSSIIARSRGRPTIRQHVDHVIQIEGTNPPLYQCRVCMKQFKTKAHSAYHKFCGREGELPFKCSMCCMGFRTKGHLQYHLGAKHGQYKEVNRPLNCNFCSKKFAFRKHLDQHLKEHLLMEGQYSSSNNGTMSSGGDDSLTQTQQVVMETPSEMRPYKCSFCNKSYKRSGHRSRHVKLCHSDPLRV